MESTESNSCELADGRVPVDSSVTTLSAARDDEGALNPPSPALIFMHTAVKTQKQASVVIRYNGMIEIRPAAFRAARRRL